MPASDPAQPARLSLTAHAAAKGAEIHAKYGPKLDWPQLLKLLDDRACVRYPCRIVFDADPLLPGEMAHAVALGARPEDGFALHVHPDFESRLDAVPSLVLYQLVRVNYGDFAGADDAESFGAAALNLSRDEYYHRLCALADDFAQRVGGPDPA